MAFPASSPRASRRADTILLASIRALVNCQSVCALFAVTLTLAGCGSTSTTNVGPSPVKCQVSLSSTSNPIGASGGAATVAVATEAECVWTASEDVTWISQLSPASGQGTGQIGFQADQNASLTSRQGDITVNGIRFQVLQDAATCAFQLSATTATVSAAGGPQSVTVTAIAGCTWSAASNASWLVVTAGGTGNSNGTVTFQVAPNTGATRSGTLTIAGQTLTVAQDAVGTGSCTPAIQPTSQSIAAAGGTGSSTVTSNPGCAWTAASNAPWLTVTSGAAGSGTATVNFNIGANAGVARTGTLTIAGQTFTVSQAAPCIYSIQPTSQSITAAGGTGSSAVTSNAGCAWTAASNAPWITVTSGAAGSGNGTVGFSIGANTAGARTGTLTIAGQTFTVNQEAPCSYSIQPTSQAIAAAGGTGSTAVSSGSGCTWTATSNAPWITVTSGATGSGNGTVAFGVAPNSTAERIGTITIAGHTFTVTQATGCPYSIQPTSQSFDNSGGSGSLAVTTNAGCAWTATSNAPWIVVTSNPTGSDDGNVTFSVAANTGAARSGTITIATQIFTVNQAAVPCTFSINPASQSIGAAGGPGSSAVTSPAICAWTATSNVPWITVTSGATGSGNGNVTFTSGANTGPARMGTLTIAGQTFTVNQASGCSYIHKPSIAVHRRRSRVGLVERDECHRVHVDGHEQRPLDHGDVRCGWQRQRNGQFQYWRQPGPCAHGHADDCWPDIHRESGQRVYLHAVAHVGIVQQCGRQWHGDGDDNRRLHVDSREQRAVDHHHSRLERQRQWKCLLPGGTEPERVAQQFADNCRPSVPDIAGKLNAKGPPSASASLRP